MTKLKHIASIILGTILGAAWGIFTGSLAVFPYVFGAVFAVGMADAGHGIIYSTLAGTILAVLLRGLKNLFVGQWNRLVFYVLLKTGKVQKVSLADVLREYERRNQPVADPEDHQKGGLQ